MKSKTYYANLVKPTPLPPTLQALEDMRDKLDLFETLNEKVIAREREEAYKGHVLANLPVLIKKGLTPWCREGAVCDVLTPCKKLKCRYKRSAGDVVNGCAKCGMFVMCDGDVAHRDARMLLDNHLEPLER